MALAFLLRVGLLLLSENVEPLHGFIQVNDSVGYVRLATNLLNSHAFQLDAGEPSAWRMPGYPILLAIIFWLGGNDKWVRFIQILCDCLTVLIVYRIGQRITSHLATSLLSMLFVVVNPWLILMSVTLIPESIVTLLLIVAVWLMLEGFEIGSGVRFAIIVVAMSVALTVAIYLKPTGLSAAILAIIILSSYRLIHYGWKPAIKSASLAAVTLIILMLPWCIRNYRAMHAFVPLTTSEGINLYGGNNALADGGYVSDYPYVLNDMTEVESNAYLKAKAADWIRQNPLAVSRLLPKKALRHLSPVAFGTAGVVLLPWNTGELLMAIFLVLYLAAIAGAAVLILGHRIWPALALLFMPIALLLPSLISFGATRFAIPAHPEVATLTAIGIAGVWSNIQARWA